MEESIKIKKYQDKDWLYDQYIILQKSINQIAKECQINYKTLRYWLLKFRIPLRERLQALRIAYRKKEKPYKYRTWLYEQYIILKKVTPEIAEICNVSSTTIKRWLERLRIPIRNPSERTQLIFDKIKLPYKNKEWLYKQYITLKKTIQEIAEICETSMTPIQYWLHKHQIPMRNTTYYNRLNWSDDSYRENQITWKTGKNNPMYGKKPHNWNPNREEVYAPYGENFYNSDYRRYKWKLQGGRDLLTGEKLIEGIRSHYHHIDYNKSNDNPDNHCWLRRKNHNKISGYQSNLIKREYYKEILQKNTELIIFSWGMKK